jgi:hypothetical protein
LIGVIVVMLLIGGAIGYVGAPTVLGDDDATEVASEAAEETTTTAAPAPDPTVWAEPYQEFEVAVPEGWSVAGDRPGLGQYVLIARPGSSNDDAYVGGGLTVTFDRRPDRSPEAMLDDLTPPDACPTDEGREPFTQGDYTGLVQTYSGCTDGRVLRRVAVGVPGGTNLQISTVALPGEDEMLVRALDTFLVPAAAATQVAPFRGCADNAPGTDPEYPLAVQFKNHLDEVVSIGWVDPDTNEVFEPQDLQPAFISGSFYAKAGDIYRVTGPAGATDYTATSEPLQCVVVNDTGFVSVQG